MKYRFDEKKFKDLLMDNNNVGLNQEKLVFNPNENIYRKEKEYIILLQNSASFKIFDKIIVTLKNGNTKKGIIKKTCGCCGGTLFLILAEEDIKNFDANPIIAVSGNAVALSSVHYFLYSPGDDDPPLPRQPLSACNGNRIDVPNVQEQIDSIEVYDYLEKNITINKDGKPVVAIIDTGIDLYYWHNYQCPLYIRDNNGCGLSEYRNYGWNFVENSEGSGNRDNRPFDDNGANKHGTRIAKIVSNVTKGDVQLLILKTFDYKGNASFFDIFCAFEYILRQGGVDIINASWGYYGAEIPLFKDYLDKLNSANIWFVNAAGNTSDFIADTPRNIGIGKKRYPACYSNTIEKVITITTIKRDSLELTNTENSTGRPIPQPDYSSAENFSDVYVNAGVGAGYDGEFSDPLYSSECTNPTIKGSSYATAHFVGRLAKDFNVLGQLSKQGVVNNICNRVVSNIGVIGNLMVTAEIV